MGTLFYGDAASSVEIQDRALAHLKVVISTKLRRGEGFTMSWRHLIDEPRGRSTIWIHPGVAIRFVFDDPEPTELDVKWLDEPMAAASSVGGIQVRPEDIAPTGLTDAPERPADVDPAGLGSLSRSARGRL